MAKPKTLSQKIDEAWGRNVTTPHGASDFRYYSDGFKAGHRAGARLTRAETWYALVSDGTEFQRAQSPEFKSMLDAEVAKRNAKIGREYWEVVPVKVVLPRQRSPLGD
jgi:hypothetical protein